MRKSVWLISLTLFFFLCRIPAKQPRIDVVSVAYVDGRGVPWPEIGTSHTVTYIPGTYNHAFCAAVWQDNEKRHLHRCKCLFGW